MATFFVGDVRQYRVNPLTLDGGPWTALAGGTATFYLRRPDGVLLVKTGSIIGLVPTYTDSSSSLTIPGQWARYWVLTDTNGVTETTQEVVFFVGAVP